MNLIEAIKTAKLNNIKHIYFNNPLENSLFLVDNQITRLINNYSGSVDVDMLLRDDYTVLKSKQIDKNGHIEIITDKNNPYIISDFKESTYYDKKLPLQRFLNVYGQKLDEIEIGLLFDIDNKMLCDFVTVQNFLEYVSSYDKQYKLVNSLLNEIGSIYVSYNS